MRIEYFFDNITSTFTYIVIDDQTNKCAIIDPVLDYDIVSGRTSTASIDKVIKFISASNLEVQWLLETHIHADHLTGADKLRSIFNAEFGIGECIKEALSYWVPIFNTANNTPVDGSQFHTLFRDGDTFSIGELEVKVMHTPGHTPACVSYLIGDAVFVGDLILMPYIGTARADFPGGDARKLYQSVQRILSLPDDTKIFTCHDYPPKGQDPCCESTVLQQKDNNIMVNRLVNEDSYIEKRTNKDAKMAMPRLLLPSIQVNMRAGYLGDSEDNGVRYIKIPIDEI